ncbi:MAG: DUF4202 domain-containing protein [Acidimicrobiales bacterium]
MAVGDERYRTAIVAIDAANAEDPATVSFEGRERPKEQLHAELMTAWVHRLDPGAEEAQLLAARAHHLRRWVLPRDEYPEGRAGYLRWRTELKRRHAAEVGAILADHGYEPEVIDRVGAIIRKEGLGTDPAVGVHEDALCLVFLQTQLDDVAARLGPDKTVDVLVKSIRKMTDQGRQAALGLSYTAASRSLVEAALAAI